MNWIKWRGGALGSKSHEPASKIGQQPSHLITATKLTGRSPTWTIFMAADMWCRDVAGNLPLAYDVGVPTHPCASFDRVSTNRTTWVSKAKELAGEWAEASALDLLWTYVPLMIDGLTSRTNSGVSPVLSWIATLAFSKAAPFKDPFNEFCQPQRALGSCVTSFCTPRRYCLYHGCRPSEEQLTGNVGHDNRDSTRPGCHFSVSITYTA